MLYLLLVGSTLVVEFPGRLYNDSLDQILQAMHAGGLNDWHSPTLTRFWTIAAPWLGIPASALLAQSILTMMFPALVIQRAIGILPSAGPCRRLIFCIYLVFCVGLIGLSGAIIKDVTLVGCVGGILCLSYRYKFLKKVYFIAGTGMLLFLSVLIRPSNFIAFGGASLICIFYLCNRRHRWRLMGLMLTFTVTFVPISTTINRSIFGAKDKHPIVQLLTFDLAGISVLSGENMFEEISGWPKNGLPPPSACYTPRRWDPFAWGPCRSYKVAMLDRLSTLHDHGVAWYWIRAVVRHPVAYTTHRLSYIACLFANYTAFDRLDETAANSPEGYVRWIQAEHVEHVDLTPLQNWSPSWPKTILSAFVIVWFELPLLGLLGLLASLWGLFWAWRHKDSARGPFTTIVVASSIGLGNIVMLGICGVADDRRYLLPTLFCGYVVLFEIALVYPPRLKEMLRERGLMRARRSVDDRLVHNVPR